VIQEIAERVPYTLTLALTAYLLAISIGVPAGMIGAIYHNRWPDYVVMIIAIMGASFANFWLALMAMNFFSVQLGWLPLLGANSWQSYILPSITLAVLPTAVIARMTRSSMIEVLGQDYVRTARAKGLSERSVVVKHAFRNAMIPITTLMAFDFAGVLGGAVITEAVFGWSGMGRMFTDGLNNVDPNVIMAFFLVTGVAAVTFNMLADIAYAFLDPRISLN
jgi:glutathione transport system permease protein